MSKKVSRERVRRSGKACPDPVIWIVRELEYRAGLQLEKIAQRHGVKPDTVCRWASRRGWTRSIDPATRIAKRLTVEIVQAETALANGEIGDAQKRVQAASALGRAAQILSRLDKQIDTNRTKGMTHINAGDDRTDFRAELERRLLRIINAIEGQSQNPGVHAELKSESGESDS